MSATFLGAALFATPASASFICNPVQGGASAPWSETKFRPLIENSSSFQMLNTNTCMTNAQMKASWYDDNWSSINGIMTFSFDAGVTGNRDEIVGYTFNGNATSKILRGRIRVSVGGDYSTGFSVAQVFSKDLAPILRLEVMDSRLGLTNHIWAFYRPLEGAGVTGEVKDLGPAPTSAFADLLIEYNVNGTISAQLGTNPKQTFSTNFSYWTDPAKRTYFKAGCYLQDSGDCKVEYSSLYFDR
jgi:hypothetical protein